jgi:hypothetical protein
MNTSVIREMLAVGVDFRLTAARHRLAEILPNRKYTREMFADYEVVCDEGDEDVYFMSCAVRLERANIKAWFLGGLDAKYQESDMTRFMRTFCSRTVHHPGTWGLAEYKDWSRVNESLKNYILRALVSNGRRLGEEEWWRYLPCWLRWDHFMAIVTSPLLDVDVGIEGVVKLSFGTLALDTHVAHALLNDLDFITPSGVCVKADWNAKSVFVGGQSVIFDQESEMQEYVLGIEDRFHCMIQQ